MAPKSTPFPLSSSQKTKQQSISSFFAPKSSPAVKPLAKPVPTPIAAAAKPASPAPSKGAVHESSLDSASDNDEEGSLPLPRSSSARRKRVVEEDDESDEDAGR